VSAIVTQRPRAISARQPQIDLHDESIVGL